MRQVRGSQEARGTYSRLCFLTGAGNHVGPKASTFLRLKGTNVETEAGVKQSPTCWEAQEDSVQSWATREAKVQMKPRCT